MHNLSLAAAFQTHKFALFILRYASKRNSRLVHLAKIVRMAKDGLVAHCQISIHNFSAERRFRL